MSYPNISTEVHGARELSRAMDNAQSDLKDLTRVNREVAQAAARESSRRAPVDTGALRGSLTGRGTKDAARVESSVKYAGPVHWGVPGRGMSPNPFIVAAVVADESTFKRLYERRLEELAEDMGKAT